jgi:hypothetical protein
MDAVVLIGMVIGVALAVMAVYIVTLPLRGK